MQRDVYFNSIYVIQSLPPEEKQTGTSLHDDIIRRRTYHFEVLKSELIDVIAKDEFIRTLTELPEMFFDKQVVPYFHFEIHGCKEGLVLKNGELVLWEELRPLLVIINYNIQNNLFISLATCYGAYIFNAIDPLDRIPFYAFVGPPVEVKVHEVEADWESYFDTLLTTRDFTCAINALNKSNTRIPYVFYTSEQIFDIVTSVFMKLYRDRKSRRIKMLELVKRAKKMTGTTDKYSDAELRDYFKRYVSNQPKVVKNMK